MDAIEHTATHVTSRLVREGREDAFARWADRLDASALAADGAVGALRLEQPTGLCHLVHRFASADDLRRWRDSPERAELAREADAFSAENAQSATGRRVAFRLPSEAAVPKWKTWVATWATVFPLLLALNAAVRALPVDLPQPVQLALTSLVLTAALTWVVLPRVRALLRPWLFHDVGGGLRKEPG